LFIEIVDFSVQIAQVHWVEAIHVGEHLFKSWNFARKKKRTASFVFHVFGSCRAIFCPCRSDASSLVVIHEKVDWVAVRRPGGKCCDNQDGVVTFSLAVAIVLESRIRSKRTLFVIIVPTKTIGGRRMPGITDDKKRRAIRLLDCVVIRSGPKKASS
jgi:hypothetical protein